MKPTPLPPSSKATRPITRRRFIGGLGLSAVAAATATSFFSGCKRPEHQYQIGAYTRAWGRRNYRVALDGMVATGYRFTGLSVHEGGRVLDRNSSLEDAAAVGDEVRARGLRIVTLSAGSFDAGAPADEGIRQLMHIVDMADVCGAPSVQINDPAKPEIEDHFYKVVGECCDYALEKGIGITIHPHGSSGAHIRTRIEKVDHENLKLLYDPGNVGFYSHGETDTLRDAEYLDGILYGMSVKDFRLPRNVNITPGTGLVDFPRLIARLHQGGFTRGPLIVECLNPGELEEVNADAIKTREFLEEIVAQLN